MLGAEQFDDSNQETAWKANIVNRWSYTFILAIDSTWVHNIEKVDKDIGSLNVSTYQIMTDAKLLEGKQVSA